jgi:hypothetical protein
VFSVPERSKASNWQFIWPEGGELDFEGDPPPWRFFSQSYQKQRALTGLQLYQQVGRGGRMRRVMVVMMMMMMMMTMIVMVMVMMMAIMMMMMMMMMMMRVMTVMVVVGRSWGLWPRRMPSTVGPR